MGLGARTRVVLVPGASSEAVIDAPSSATR